MDNGTRTNLNGSTEPILNHDESGVDCDSSSFSETTDAKPISTGSGRKFRSDSDSEEESNPEDEETKPVPEPTSTNIFQRMKNWFCPRTVYAAVGPSDTKYNMNHAKRGKCIVFNHFEYVDKLKLGERKGTEKDVENIMNAFTSFGFDVIVHNDLNLKQIMEHLKAVSQEDHSVNDCLAVFVLTHGETDQLSAYDNWYKPSELWCNFTAEKCPTLATKPKMFFLQACRGTKFDLGTEVKHKTYTCVDSPSSRNGGSSSIYRIPNQADFLVVYSTFEGLADLGHYSFRNGVNGGCFIKALCDVFGKYRDDRDVISMMTLVNNQVAIEFESQSKGTERDGKKQMPQFSSTLTRFLFLKDKC